METQHSLLCIVSGLWTRQQRGEICHISTPPSLKFIKPVFVLCGSESKKNKNTTTTKPKLARHCGARCFLPDLRGSCTAWPPSPRRPRPPPGPARGWRPRRGSEGWRLPRGRRRAATRGRRCAGSPSPSAPSPAGPPAASAPSPAPAERSSPGSAAPAGGGRVGEGERSGEQWAGGRRMAERRVGGEVRGQRRFGEHGGWEFVMAQCCLVPLKEKGSREFKKPSN